MAEPNKQPTAAIAREIMRRQNGYEADPNINLSEYGYNENTDPELALRKAAKLDSGIGYQNTYRNNYDQAADKAIEKIQNNSTPYDAELKQLVKPEYKSQYDDKIKGLVDDIVNNEKYQSDPKLEQWMDKILNGEKFNYDVNGDALYAGYKDAYTKNAKSAAEDAMGRAVSASGGWGNSYAQAAANQAYNSQMQGLNDKIPELYQLAYDKYKDDRQRTIDEYSMLASADATKYGRYKDILNDKYNQLGLLTDRENTDYSRYRDTYSDYLTDRDYLTNRADNYRNDQYKQTDMFTSLSEMAFNREKYAADKNYQDAVAAANVGDFSLLGDYLGIDTSEAKQWYDIQKGIDLYDATGMVDYLDRTGLDTTELKENIKDEKFKNNLTVAAAVFESTGDDSYLKKLGLDTSYVKKINEYQLMAAQKAANGSSGGSGGGRSSSEDRIKNNEDDEEAARIRAVVDDATAYMASHIGVATDSMTVDYYLNSKGYNQEERNRFKAQMQKLGAPNSGRSGVMAGIINGGK